MLKFFICFIVYYYPVMKFQFSTPLSIQVLVFTFIIIVKNIRVLIMLYKQLPSSNGEKPKWQLGLCTPGYISKLYAKFQLNR